MKATHFHTGRVYFNCFNIDTACPLVGSNLTAVW